MFYLGLLKDSKEENKGFSKIGTNKHLPNVNTNIS